MIIQSSTIGFQSHQEQHEKQISRDSAVVSNTRTQPQDDFSYKAEDEESLSLYTEVSRPGQPTQEYSRQRFAETMVAMETASGTELVSSSAGQISGAAVSDGLSVRFSRYRYVSEDQSSLIVSSGVINLEDGRELNFNLYFNRARESELSVQQSFSVEVRPVTDPLVVNFAADSVALSSDAFFFDLNADGEQEKIAGLKSGSGFLVLDLNANGEIDDGTELFGPQTGSGFGELARYDDDGNRWIDEQDPVFSQLKVWVDAGSAHQRLMTLSEVGIGAIYLGSTGDHFDLVSNQGMLLGRTKAAGIMLMENGEVKTVQEIDLANQQDAVTSKGKSGLSPLSEAEQGRLSTIREGLTRLQDIRTRQQQQMESVGTRKARLVSPLELMLAKLEMLRDKLMDELNFDETLKSRDLQAVVFKRDELTYQLMHSKFK